MYSISDVAAEGNINPRSLRRFLRDNDSWKNVGLGGRYSFTEAEKQSLIRQYKAMAKKNAKTQVPERGDQPGISVAAMQKAKRDKELRKRVLEKRKARHVRLQAQIKSANLPTRTEIEN